MKKRIDWDQRAEEGRQLGLDGRAKPVRPYIDWKGRRGEVEGLIARKVSLKDLAAHFGCDHRAAGAAIRRLGLKMDDEARVERCRAHLSVIGADPVAIAKRTASQKQTNAKTKNRLRRSRAARKQWRDAETRARTIEGLRRYRTSLPAEVAAAQGRKGGLAHTAWCPPERLEEYRALRVKLKSAKEAKRIILADVLAKERAARGRPKRRLSFDEQLAAAAAGAELIFIPHIPMPDPIRTLGGIPSGAF